MIKRLEQEVDVKGTAYIVLALDLGAFVAADSQSTLLSLRGRREFNQFLQNFNPNDPRFERDDNYKTIEQRGYELGVFNRILAEENFVPTYRLVKNRVVFPAELMNNVQFKDKFLTVWKKWNFWFRLSGNGVMTIILELDIPKPRPLILLSRDVMGLQGHFDMENARQKLAELQADEANPANVARIQSIHQFIDWVRQHSMVDVEREFPAVLWQMAVEVVHQFVDACGGCLSNESSPLSFRLNLKPEPDRSGVGSLREKYTIFNFTEMGHYNWETRKRQLLTPEQAVNETYQDMMAGLLEGVLIKGKSDFYYPVHSQRHMELVVAKNMSSWENEICILTDRSAVIFPYMPKQSHGVVFSSQNVPYSKYWECVLRSLEFGVESRLLVQLAKQMTSAYLADALLVIKDNHVVADGNLKDLDFKTANVARLLSHLRAITAPHVIAQANYSVDKLELFLQETGILEVLGHAEKNLNDLSLLIEHTHDVNLHHESQRLNELTLKLSLIFGGLTFGLAILALPSFILDWEGEKNGFLSERIYYPILSHIGEILVFVLAIMGLMMFAAATWSLSRTFRQQWRKSLSRWVVVLTGKGGG